MLFEFVLFAILGFLAYAPTTAMKNLLLIVFVVMMVIWLFVGLSGVQIPHLTR